MKYFKIYTQTNRKKKSIRYFLNQNNIEYLIGISSYSFAISYNPETFNNFLNKQVIQQEFEKKYIQQVFISNQKFFAIIENSLTFHLKMIDLKFTDDESNVLLESETNLDLKLLNQIIHENNSIIKEVLLEDIKNKSKVIFQKNGVMGLDDYFVENENKEIRNILDVISIGLKVLNYDEYN